jgi:hypothetical protein
MAGIWPVIEVICWCGWMSMWMGWTKMEDFGGPLFWDPAGGGCGGRSGGFEMSTRYKYKTGERPGGTET